MPTPEMPFRHNLVNAGFGKSGLLTFAHDPEKIVRYLPRHESAATQVEEARVFLDCLTELTDDYNIAVPNPTFVVGHDSARYNHQPVTYVIADRVHGNTMDYPAKIGKIFVPAFTETLANCIRYYRDKINNGGIYLEDLAMFQCMYGYTARDKTLQAFFVDLDPYTDCFTPDNPSKNSVGAIHTNLSDLAQSALQIQQFAGIDARPFAQDILQLDEALPHAMIPEDSAMHLHEQTNAIYTAHTV